MLHGSQPHVAAKLRNALPTLCWSHAPRLRFLAVGVRPGTDAGPERIPGRRLGWPESGPGSLARGGRRFVALLLDWLIGYGLAGLAVVRLVRHRSVCPPRWVHVDRGGLGLLGVVSVRLFGFTLASSRWASEWRPSITASTSAWAAPWGAACWSRSSSRRCSPIRTVAASRTGRPEPPSSGADRRAINPCRIRREFEASVGGVRRFAPATPCRRGTFGRAPTARAGTWRRRRSARWCRAGRRRGGIRRRGGQAAAEVGGIDLGVPRSS